MKGKIMNTENTTVTTEEVELTPAQIAENFIKEHSFGDLVDEFVNHYNTIESLKRQVEYAQSEARNQRSRWASMSETIEEFLKDHIKDNDSASVNELKELAEELEIELTKTVKVTFTIECEYEITIPIDADEDMIGEGDFDYSVSYRNNNDDYEETSESYEITNFETEEM